jgi:N-alpha-acetyltransferase 35, NatC auxiliary subunit
VLRTVLLLQMAWHMGHPLSQTLFTSIYLDRLLWPIPESFDDARFGRDQTSDARDVERGRPWAHLVLRAYCLALVKACDLVLARVTSECYYEVSFPTLSASFLPALFIHSALTVNHGTSFPLGGRFRHAALQPQSPVNIRPRSLLPGTGSSRDLA